VAREKQSKPVSDCWRRLYDVFIRVRDAAPWRIMYEDDIFAVRDPRTSECGFVSVMGMRGEHFAVAVYLGLPGLNGFVRIQDKAPEIEMMDLLMVRHLQASLEDREQLMAEDLKPIRELGLKFRGAKAWPCFRSYRPGFYPWSMDADEVRRLTIALEQLLEELPRFRQDPGLIRRDDGEMLVREARTVDGATVWEDRFEREFVADEVEVPIQLAEDSLEAFIRLPVNPGRIEIDLVMLPAPVREGRGAPFFPFLLLLMQENGPVVGMEMLTVQTSLLEMHSLVPQIVLDKLLAGGLRPREFLCRSDDMETLLGVLSAEFQIPVTRLKRLKGIEKFMKEMDQLGL